MLPEGSPFLKRQSLLIQMRSRGRRRVADTIPLLGGEYKVPPAPEASYGEPADRSAANAGNSVCAC